MSVPLRALAARWAWAMSIPPEVVSFEVNDTGEEVDLDMSPADLGWTQSMRLTAFPNDAEYMEEDFDVDSEHARSPTSLGALQPSE